MNKWRNNGTTKFKQMMNAMSNRSAAPINVMSYYFGYLWLFHLIASIACSPGVDTILPLPSRYVISQFKRQLQSWCAAKREQVKKKIVLPSPPSARPPSDKIVRQLEITSPAFSSFFILYWALLLTCQAIDTPTSRKTHNNSKPVSKYKMMKKTQSDVVDSRKSHLPQPFTPPLFHC